MAEQLNIILIPHTHWDREWYQTFQQFRIRLVHAIDKLLYVLDSDPDFSHFMLDGQTIVLDDYLEVRPEEEERLKKYTRSGRITVGPWYTQPDEFLVSGESLIRNLQIGLRRAAEFGEPMRVGYVPDCFGHIAQLPQILKGMGIDSAVFWRGVGAEAHKSEFYWAAPDGTRTLVIYLGGGMGYSNARDMPLAPAEFVARVELLITPLLAKATTNTLLFMNGSDHLEPQNGLPAVIRAANEQLAHIKLEHASRLTQPASTDQSEQEVAYDGLYDGIQVRIGTLPQYVAAVQEHIAQVGEDSLQMLSGEMRSSQFSHLLPSVLSTRMWIKQQNAATEHLLERWVEPLTAWAWKLGASYPDGLVRLAWRYLLQNHPHDSICGCSIDQVHRENSARFAQSQQIAEQITKEAQHYLVMFTDTRAPVLTPSQDEQTREEAAPIVVFNPAPGPRSETVRVPVQLPDLTQHVAVVDEYGKRMPYHVVDHRRPEPGTITLTREMAAGRETIEFVAADLPAYGLKTFWVYPHGLPDDAGTPFIAPASSLVANSNSIENEFYRVEASRQDGTLTVTDKQTGAVFAGLHRFVDSGDVGDLYNYCPPANDLLVSEPAQPPTIEVIHSPVSARLRISGQWSLPNACSADRASRSEERTLCPISSEVTLTPGARRVNIHTSIDNLVKDHIIRVAFPVLYKVESATAEGAFEVRTRPVAALRPDNVSEWSEEPVNCFPQKRFVDISNGAVGLGVLNRGLPEYEVVQNAAGEQAVAVTLLRCVEWLSRSDLSTRRGHAGPMLYTPEGQCLGHHEFDYALVTHSGDWEAEEALVLREAQAFNTPARAIATRQHAGSLPSVTGMMEVEPRSAVLSAVKRSNNSEGIIARIYNPLPHAVEASLRPGFACEKAFVANLLEEAQEQLFWNGGEPLHIGLRSGEIATILFL